jgi:2-methylisocitrate lyase-like PEP mutase family enzyme
MDSRMSQATRSKAAEAFKALHAGPRGFIMPNAWDAGSAIMLAAEGFPAIATTSAGIAFSMGKPDYHASAPHLLVVREKMLERMREIADAVGLPVNGDLEAAYGASPADVASTISLAIEAGLAGGNIEDKKPDEHGLFDEALAVERIAAARAAIDAKRSAFVLTARTDACLVSGPEALKTCIRRANLFRQAGADCLYAPGIVELDAVKTLLREIDGPLNVVVGLGSAGANAQTLIAAGVRRISLGGSIARSALGFIRGCARELRETGTLRFAADQVPQGELNALFARARGG